MLLGAAQKWAVLFIFLTKIIWIYCFFFVPLQWDYCTELVPASRPQKKGLKALKLPTPSV